MKMKIKTVLLDIIKIFVDKFSPVFSFCSDFGGHGNARGATGYLNMPFFNHAQLLNSMGPSYEAHPENHI